MYQLVIKFLIFCLAPLPFLYTLQLIVDKGLKESNNRFYCEWNDIYNGEINADLLVVGSSRARRHFSTLILDEELKLYTYNLGMNGWTFPMENARVNIYLKHNRKPKYIIQSMDLQMLYRRDDLFEYQQFLPYLDDPDVQLATKGYKGEFGNAQYYFPMFKYNGNLDLAAIGIFSYFNMKVTDRSSRKGYEALTFTWDDSLDKLKKIAPNGYRIYVDPVVEEEFKNYLIECQKGGIKIIMIYSPIYVEFSSLIINKNEILTRFKEYSKKFNIPFLDYSTHPISLNRDYFSDFDHLNEKGAEIFSKVLVEDLKNLKFIND